MKRVRERPRPSRRTFVKGLAVGGAVASLGYWDPAAWAQTPEPTESAVLSGTDFDLRISETPMTFTGAVRRALTINGTIPAPTLRWREGDTVTIRVANALGEHASIHWHGIVLPANMDGVPGLSFDGIHPGETFAYRFRVRQGGQYVHPVTVDEFRIAVAETLDVIVEPSGQDAFTVFAQAMDRTGFAAGTLATRRGLQAPVPSLDPRPVLTMADMGMGEWATT